MGTEFKTTVRELMANVVVTNLDDDELLLDTSKIDKEMVDMLVSDLKNNCDIEVDTEWTNKDELEEYLNEEFNYQCLVEFAYFTSQGYEPEFDKENEWINWPEEYVDVAEYEFYFPDFDITITAEYDIDTL